MVGRSGSGKTFICRHIAISYRRRGWTPIPVSSFQDLFRVINPSSKHLQLYVLDDPLGKECLDIRLSIKLRSYEDKISEYLKHTENVKLLITSRYVIERISLDFNNVIIYSSSLQLSSEEKLGIMACHKCSSWGLQEEDRHEILLIEDFFPLLCSMYTKYNPYRKYGLSFFKTPTRILEKEILICKSIAKEQYCALLLLVVNNGHLNEDFFTSDRNKDRDLFADICEISGLPRDTSRIVVLEQLKSFCGNLVTLMESAFSFRHDYISETVTLIFGKDFPREFLKLGPMDFICRNVLLKGTSKPDDMQTVLEIDERLIDTLIDRVFSEFSKGPCIDICFSNLFHSEKCIYAICEKIESLNDEDFKCLFLTTHRNIIPAIDLIEIVFANTTTLERIAQSIVMKLNEDGFLSAFEEIEHAVVQLENHKTNHKSVLISNQSFSGERLVQRKRQRMLQLHKASNAFLRRTMQNPDGFKTLCSRVRDYLVSVENKDITLVDMMLTMIFKTGFTEENKQNLLTVMKSSLKLIDNNLRKEWINIYDFVFGEGHINDIDMNILFNNLYKNIQNIMETHPCDIGFPNEREFLVFEKQGSLKLWVFIMASRISVANCLALSGHQKIFECILRRIQGTDLMESHVKKLFISACAVGSLEFMKLC